VANVRVTGTAFQTATDGPVDLMTLALLSGSRDYYDPSGVNAGSTQPGATILTWTETLIEVNDPSLDGETITDAYVSDIDADYNVPFDVTPDLAVLTYPLIESICSPAPDTIRFVGQRFLTATAGAIGYVIPRLAHYASGALLNGPNMIVNLSAPPANWTLVSHTDNEITLSNPDFTNEEPFPTPGDFVVNGAAFHDPTATTMYYYEPPANISFSNPVDGVGCPPQVANVVPGGNDEIVISGTDLDNTTRFRVFDNLVLDEYYYDSLGPNAGLNPVGATVTVTPTLVTINDPALSGLTISQVQARTGTLPGDIVPLGAEWFGFALVS